MPAWIESAKIGALQGLEARNGVGDAIAVVRNLAQEAIENDGFRRVEVAQRVEIEAARKVIAALAPVIAAAASDGVPAIAAREPLVAAAAEYLVIADIAVDRVVAGA